MRTLPIQTKSESLDECMVLVLHMKVLNGRKVKKYAAKILGLMAQRWRLPSHDMCHGYANHVETCRPKNNRAYKDERGAVGKILISRPHQQSEDISERIITIKPNITATTKSSTDSIRTCSINFETSPAKTGATSVLHRAEGTHLCIAERTHPISQHTHAHPPTARHLHRIIPDH